jgi:hypothetical protein
LDEAGHLPWGKIKTNFEGQACFGRLDFSWRLKLCGFFGVLSWLHFLIEISNAIIVIILNWQIRKQKRAFYNRSMLTILI